MIISSVETVERGSESLIRLRGEGTFIREWEERLFYIVDRHISRTDSLSVDLVRWSVRVSSVIESGSVRDVALIVHELRRIISSGLDHSPITAPVEAYRRLWDQWMLDDVNRLFKGKSPYDESGSERGEAHLFAREVLQSVQEFFLTGPLYEELKELCEKEDRSKWVLSVDRSLYSDQEMKKCYKKLIEIQRKNEDADKMISIYGEYAEELTVIKAKAEEFARRQIELVRDSYVEMRSWVAETVATIRSIYTRQIKRLEISLERAKDELEKLNREHEKIVERVSILENHVSNLQDTIKDLRRRVHEMESDDGGGCIVM